MMLFQIKERLGDSEYLNWNDHGELAEKLWYTYGLEGFFSIPEVEKVWTNYSESRAESWTRPTKGTVEYAFNISLVEAGTLL